MSDEIGACRPVVWGIWYQAVLSEEPPVYPGSIVGRCRECGDEIYIGPKMQKRTSLPLVCMRCAAAAVLAAGGSYKIHDLGNTYRPRPR